VSIGFQLLGRFKNPQLEPDGLFHRLEKWILAQCSQLQPIMRRGFVDEKLCLFTLLHPAAEELEITLPDPHHITVSANTSTVSPGYHIYLCDLLHRWSDEFSLDWIEFGRDDDTTFGDETGYFFSADPQMVYDEMELWLRALASTFFDGTMDPDDKENALCMPMNVQFTTDSLAITQLGPRDKDWLRRLSQGSVECREFFPWYDRGLNAEYHLGRVLVQMWSDVRWRKPCNDSERSLVESVLQSLDVSHRMNPDLHFPWNEWSELLGFMEHPVPYFVRVNVAGPGHIGYRRSNVRTCLPGNWWIDTEGSFSTFEPDENDALCSLDPPREIWFTAYTFSAQDPRQTFLKMRDTALGEKHQLVHQQDNYISVADIEEKGRWRNHYYILTSTNIGILCRSICTLVFKNPLDRAWAIRVWKSLKSPKPPESTSNRSDSAE
jgi:hypothetical protein